jgi:PAS domain S-box-containing protein
LPTQTLSPESGLRLLQELQIHQIELELQNEELKQAKIEIEAGLTKYTDLYNFAPVGYFTLDVQGVILELNLTGATLLGPDRSRLVGRRFQWFVASASRATVQSMLLLLHRTQTKQTCEAFLQLPDQSNLTVNLEATPFLTPDGKKSCAMVVIDVSARKQAEIARHQNEILAASNQKLELEILRRQAVEESLSLSEHRAQILLKRALRLKEELRMISHMVINVQETQRKEISRRLHDEISQLLVGINVQLSIFSKNAVNDPENVGRTIKPLRKLVEESVKIVHRFARELRPAMLDDLGLIPALRSYIDDFPRRKNQQIHFSAFAGVEALNNNKRTAFYRIAQEGLTNAAKHSKASEINVVIRKLPEGACLEVIDNGKAFNLRRILAVRGGPHLGVIGMRERMEMVGGTLKITSKVGQGTTIQAIVPFAGRAKRV